jgi:hypothetical protein
VEPIKKTMRRAVSEETAFPFQISRSFTGSLPHWFGCRGWHDFYQWGAQYRLAGQTHAVVAQ